jgi:hypothetical protein
VAYLALFVALGGTALAAGGTVFSSDIVDGEVKTPDLASAGVTSAKLANNAVTSSRIADGTVFSPDLANASVTNPKLGNNAVTSAKIAPEAVTIFDMAPDSVSGSRILDLTVGVNDLAADSVHSEKIFDGAVHAEDINAEGGHAVGGAGEPAYENSWGEQDPVRWGHTTFWHDEFHVVHLSGGISGGTIGARVFVLPTAECPGRDHAFPVVSAGNTIGVVEVRASDCGVYVMAGTNTLIVLDGVEFPDSFRDA